jgi:RimJ/RimL family protein N-acetyltransferase
MVERASSGSSLLADTLTRVPDVPRWIDTRGMLLSGRADVLAAPASQPGDAGSDGSGRSSDQSDPASDPSEWLPPSGGSRARGAGTAGAIVVVRDSALVSIVGRPPERLLMDVVSTMAGDVNVLAQMEDADYVGRALAGWRRQRAIVHALPAASLSEATPDPQARVFTMESAPRFEHVPEPLRRELLDALRGRTVSRFVPGALPPSSPVVSRITVSMAAVWAEGRPVAFCYPVWQTETLWDVSIETLEPYRRLGLGGRAARTLIHHLQESGRSPVWGALETNTASRALAARLGFVEEGGLAVFTAP